MRGGAGRGRRYGTGAAVNAPGAERRAAGPAGGPVQPRPVRSVPDPIAAAPDGGCRGCLAPLPPLSTGEPVQGTRRRRWTAGRRHEAAGAAGSMAAAGGGGARRGLLKRKPNFTLQELEVLMSEVLRYEPLLFGAAAGTVNAYEKQKIWWRITHKVNAAGRHQRDIGEVKNRWRGLRRRAGDKISRHRLERQGPAGRAAARNGNTGSTGNNGSNGNGAAESGPGPAPAPVWGPRGAAGTDPSMRSAEGSAQHGECAGSGSGTGQGHGDAGPGRKSGETYTEDTDTDMRDRD